MQKRSRFTFFKKNFLLPCSALIVSFFANEEGGKNLFFMGRGRNYLFNNPFFMWGLEKDSISPLSFFAIPVMRASILFLLPQHSGKCRLIMRDIIILYPFFSFSHFKVRRSERRTSAHGIRQRSDCWRGKNSLGFSICYTALGNSQF